jgi:beta-lactamase class A
MFPNRLKASAPRNWVVRHKTGTGPDNAGVRSAVNDVGILTSPDGRNPVQVLYGSSSSLPGSAKKIAALTGHQAFTKRTKSGVWETYGFRHQGTVCMKRPMLPPGLLGPAAA